MENIIDKNHDRVMSTETENSITEPHIIDTCKGCLAHTGNYLCDLGMETEPIRRNGVQIGTRPLGKCMKPLNINDYLTEHLMRI